MTDYGWHKAPFGTLHHFRGIFRFMIKICFKSIGSCFRKLFSMCWSKSIHVTVAHYGWHTTPSDTLFIPKTFFQVFPCWNMLQTHWIVFLQATLNVKRHANSHHRAKLWMIVLHLLAAIVMAVAFWSVPPQNPFTL